MNDLLRGSNLERSFTKNGIDPPKALYRGISIRPTLQNLKTSSAHRASIILWTAANNSITKDNGVLIFGEDNSEPNIAIPKLTGTPMTIAIAGLTKAPIIYGKAPNDSRPSTEFQLVPVKKTFKRKYLYRAFLLLRK